jgi:hypothetical protein
MFKNDTINLAFSIHTNPGTHALLLGSGISRQAGVPTGWEIVGDLIKKVSKLHDLTIESDPYAWYKKQYGEEPQYSKILEQLAKTQIERESLLRKYFEPSESEAEEGVKQLTDTHRCIASLIKNGYIRIILTTNFDRLLEKALEEKGITPTIISNEDSLEGAIPYIHSSCTLVKLNGDYMDTRIKNTPQELEIYSQKFNDFLDRIFDEFGIIICGWSGEWDVALKNALLRCKTKRFNTYWLSKGVIGESAKRIIEHRGATVIKIESANKFFVDVNEKIDSLKEFEQPHPLSLELAKVTMKRYLSEEDKYHIRIFDIIKEETEKIWKLLHSEAFDIQKWKLDKDAIVKKIHEYEQLTEMLVTLLIPLAYFDDRGKNSYLATQVIDRLAEPPRTSGSTALIAFQGYPSLLLIYSVGIAALAKENWCFFKHIFLETTYRGYSKKEPILEYINPWYVLRSFPKEFIPRENAKNEYTPENNYLYDVMYGYIKDYIPDEKKYEELFDTFEFLVGVIYIYMTFWLNRTEEEREFFKKEEYPSHSIAGGRFMWKYFGRRALINKEDNPMEHFIKKGISQGDNWGLLKQGFFDGSSEIFKLCLSKHKNIIKAISSRFC